MGARLHLETLGNGAAALNEQNSVLLPLRVELEIMEDGEEFLQKRDVSLQMLDDLNLVEEDERIQDGEGGVV